MSASSLAQTASSLTQSAGRGLVSFANGWQKYRFAITAISIGVWAAKSALLPAMGIIPILDIPGFLGLFGGVIGTLYGFFGGLFFNNNNFRAGLHWSKELALHLGAAGSVAGAGLAVLAAFTP